MTILRCKIAIVGDAEVGKTALTTVFSKQGKSFPQNYAMTLGVDFCVKHVKIPETNTQVEMYIFDTSGHDIYKKFRAQYWEGSSMLMVVFDMMNLQSFKNVKSWIAEATKVMGKGSKTVPGILVGTKSDLKDHSQITYDDAVELANEFGMGYFECSAQQGKDVDVPFNFLADKFYRSYQEKIKALKEVND